MPPLLVNWMLIGIGGGSADFVVPDMTKLSIAPPILRMIYRAFAQERSGGAGLRELTILSMVNGASQSDSASPEWLTDEEVGQHGAPKS